MHSTYMTDTEAMSYQIRALEQQIRQMQEQQRRQQEAQERGVTLEQINAEYDLRGAKRLAERVPFDPVGACSWDFSAGHVQFVPVPSNVDILAVKTTAFVREYGEQAADAALAS
jgi:hypothetical protein